MEWITLTADEGKWYTKEPTKEWQRRFWSEISTTTGQAAEYVQVTDEWKADYERRRAEYLKQINEQDEEE